mmetsp:Transcript_30107/g.41969  ORF Transcript_30107/g.41969 Transcript_30107/m.41969 type:complete len:127 (-) Transcript_30107:489-869(-)
MATSEGAASNSRKMTIFFLVSVGAVDKCSAFHALAELPSSNGGFITRIRHFQLPALIRVHCLVSIVNVSARWQGEKIYLLKSSKMEMQEVITPRSPIWPPFRSLYPRLWRGLSTSREDFIAMRRVE